VTASQSFDSLIANLWRFQSCATTESITRNVGKGSAFVKTCNLAPASIIRRIIAEYVAASSHLSRSLKREKRAGTPKEE
jgi:hypothetical protein